MDLMRVLGDEEYRLRCLFLPWRLSRRRLLLCPCSELSELSSLEPDVLEGLLEEGVDELGEELDEDDSEPDGDSDGVLVCLERSTFLRAVPR
jgi:hypothetical protein